MPRIVDHDKQRAELLAGSFALFAERGYGVVTMRGLSKSLGISTGSLYHYFDSKPAMFRQLLLARAEQDIADAEAEVPADLDADGRLTALLGWLESGQIQSAPVTEYAFDRVADAHRAIESAQTTGKLVLVPTRTTVEADQP